MASVAPGLPAFFREAPLKYQASALAGLAAIDLSQEAAASSYLPVLYCMGHRVYQATAGLGSDSSDFLKAATALSVFPCFTYTVPMALIMWAAPPLGRSG